MSPSSPTAPPSALASTTRPESLGIVTPRGFPGFPPHWELTLSAEPSSDGMHELAGYHLRNGKNDGAPLLVIFHGFGEYSGRYMHFASYLDSTLGEIALVDHLGHGRSQGKRGHALALDGFTEDMERFLAKTLRETRARSVFVLGHSFGGLLVLRALAQGKPSFAKVTGVLISSPYLALKLKVPTVKKIAASVLARTWSGLSLSTAFDASVLSRDSGVMEAYEADRLNHSRMTPGMFAAITAAQNELFSKPLESPVPIAFWVSSDDPLVDGSVTIAYYESKLHGPSREIFSFPGQRHEMMNDLAKDQFFASIAQWMRDRAGGTGK